jgi:hypothetical protein
VTSTTPMLDDLVAASPELDHTEQRLAVTLYRSLAAGQPVSVRTLARQTDIPEAHVVGTLAAWPGVFPG